MNLSNLPKVTTERIKSQLGLSDSFNILSIDKNITSAYDRIGCPQIKTASSLPEDWYLITVEDKKKGFVNGFARLQNIISK